MMAQQAQQTDDPLPPMARQGLGLIGVRKRYGSVEPVRGVDLDIAAGEFVVILGPSGCGKSTILRMIAGLEDVSAGEIHIAGEPVTHLPPRKRGCAMVFQNYALYPHLTVAGNIGYPLRIAKVPARERDARVAEAARIVSLGDLLHRKPSQLSGGQRQRVAMARAIIRQPKIFLFDEPLSNLDAQLRVQMRAEIRLLHQRVGVTSIFVTHDQVEAMTLADRIVVMNTGVIEQIGTPVEVYRTPATRYVASFVGAQQMRFLPAVVSADGGRLDVGQAGGFALPMPLPADRHGRPVVLGLRPEHVRLVAEPTAETLAGRLTFTEELGSQAIHHIEIAGVDILAEGVSGSRPEAGAALIVADPGAVHLFDQDSGRRLEA